jgi:hypothetical protein
VTGSFSQLRTAIVTVSPDVRFTLDAPAAGRVSLPTTIAGWVVDASSPSDTGIDAVHVWASPFAGGAPIFVGAATYGIPRPDVGALFGNQALANSGFALSLTRLPAGRYRLIVFARRIGAATFDAATFVDIDVDDSLHRMTLDLPSDDQVVGGPFQVAGWAIDLSAGSGNGSGIDVVHVWAAPLAGGAPIFLGAAQYGLDRPDVAALYGSDALKSGFTLTVTSLPPGAYQVQAYGRNIATGQFDEVAVRRVSVVGGAVAARVER